MGTAAWAWHRAGDPAEFGGFAADRARFLVPGIASSGGSRLDRGGMEKFGAQPARKVLSADRGGAEATSDGAIEMEAPRSCDYSRDASGARGLGDAVEDLETETARYGSRRRDCA